jgi:cytidylate kinase
MKQIIIAIDGPAGAGKSSTAAQVAQALGYLYIDTGAMYRAMAVHILKSGVDRANTAALEALIDRAEIFLEPRDDGKNRVFLNGREVTEEIRTPEITRESSPLSQIPRVRTRLIDLQRQLGRSGGVVMEGRDIGTVVFPQAQLKIFMVATPQERAKRRLLELQAKGLNQPLEQVLAEIQERDQRDAARSASPLKPAPDAVHVDTTGLTLTQQVAFIVEKARNIIKAI